MRRSPLGNVELGFYAAAIPLLLRNPAIIVVPLLMLIAGVLVGQLLTGGLGGFAGLFQALLGLFGLGAACIMADEAWRRGRASFENGWSEARRKAGDIFMAAIGVTLLFTVAGYLGAIVGPLAFVIMAAAAVFLIYSIPAASIGGVPGAASIQISVDRVRSSPLPAVIVTVVSIAVIWLATFASTYVTGLLLPYTGAGGVIVDQLIGALLEAIAAGYIALILAKAYANASFGGRW